MFARTHRRQAAAWHLHWFRRTGDDPLGPAGMYACRCGQRRPGL